MAEFKIDRFDFERDVNGNYVVASWIVDEIARGNEPATGSAAYLRALAEEVRRSRDR